MNWRHSFPFFKTSFVQTISQTPHEIYSFVKNRCDESGRMVSRQTEDVVMLASRHSQRRIARAQILEGNFAGGNALHYSLQSRDVVTDLGGFPLRPCVTDYRAKIGSASAVRM